MNGLILFLGTLVVLVLGKPVFIPLIIAAFLWYLTNAISAYYRKLLPCKESGLTLCKTFDVTAFLLSIATLIIFVFAFSTQIRPMFTELSSRLPEIQSSMITLVNYLSDALGIRINPSSLPDFTVIAANIGMSLGNAVLSFGMVLVYMLFMFIEQSTFKKKISHLFPDNRKLKKINFILNSIAANMKKYMFMKTAISLATSILAYLWLKYLGIEFAGVWAFVVFITNYIPTFGAIVSTALPLFYSLITADTLQTPLLVAGGLVIIQILLGNIIEPKLTGKTLNISTLAILINLIFWGMIWGAIGMFFSVPLLMTIFIITAQFDKTRWVAILLSANGEIPAKEED
ncbi:MAG: AI-2E family transporter [Alphaproteobacteria bacterium]